MHYYIDGYNLLFRSTFLDKDFSTHRQKLIEELNQKIALLELKVTIVFDAQYQESEETRSHFRNLEIIFTALNQTADDRILEEIQTGGKVRQKTVVTSDKKLAWFARRCSANTETIEQFLFWLNKRYQNKLRQKGPVKLSKKPVLIQEKITLKPETLAPPSTAKAEECHDYYLEAFQKQFEKLESEQPIKLKEKKKTPAPQKKRKSKKPPRHDDEKPISDIDRWLSIFESKLL